ncbi:poly-gamma-glutamate synthase PgsB [bacterium AH-315-J21]|nr:poly-gamma-glutamate synthase PgsB [bacterium AH-315-J21]
MTALSITLLLLVIVSTYMIAQASRHAKYLHEIPIRIHVNGTRGKSSVTRLIAAGLRAGGITAIAKTTGTKPRFIYSDGSEVPVVRAGKANIIEQVRIVRRAAELGAEALVVECMAIRPELQSLLEDRIIKSTHAVITNARADHLDLMGPTVTDVAYNLSRTVAQDGVLFTAEREYLPMLCERAEERNCSVNVALEESIPDTDMMGFSYFEHAENVALSLAVCQALGVERQVALRGMHDSTPDPGALRMFRLEVFGKKITFINAFAINDPDSYIMVWKRLKARVPADARFVTIVTTRADRAQRAEQLSELIAGELQADLSIVAGEGARPVVVHAKRNKDFNGMVEDFGDATPADIFERVLTFAATGEVVVYGIGNIVGAGEEIVNYFRSRGKEVVYGNTTKSNN